MSAFGGGLGGNGEVCGALIGALATMGLRFGRNREEEKEDPKLSIYTKEVLKHFREEIVKNHSGIRCSEIAGVDWRNPVERANFFKGGAKLMECTRIVGDTARFIGELLERQT